MEYTFVEILTFILVALFGHALHILAKLSQLEKQERFDARLWLKDNLFSTILGLASSIAGIIILAGLDQLNYATAVLVGYTGDSLIKNAASKFKQKIKTDGGEAGK